MTSGEKGAPARDCIVVYLGSGSVPAAKVERVVRAAFAGSDRDVYVAGVPEAHTEGNLHFAPRFDFAELLPKAACFVHHGGQNSTMDALASRAAQVVVPGRVFERRYNAESIERAGAGVALPRFDAESLAAAIARVTADPSFATSAEALRQDLSSLGGAAAIVAAMEEALA